MISAIPVLHERSSAACLPRTRLAPTTSPDPQDLPLFDWLAEQLKQPGDVSDREALRAARQILEDAFASIEADDLHNHEMEMIQ